MVDHFEAVIGNVSIRFTENVENYMDMLGRRLKSWMTKCVSDGTDTYEYKSLCHRLINQQPKNLYIHFIEKEKTM